jgi:hypothetical protein
MSQPSGTGGSIRVPGSPGVYSYSQASGTPFQLMLILRVRFSILAINVAADLSQLLSSQLSILFPSLCFDD